MEKRSLARIQPFIARCVISWEKRRLVAYITDLSLGGVQVACDEPPPAPETDVSLEARFDPRAEATRLSARVRWAKPASRGHACGLTFDGLGAEEESILQAVIERILRQADRLS
jgi:hypothetical protein